MEATTKVKIPPIEKAEPWPARRSMSKVVREFLFFFVMVFCLIGASAPKSDDQRGGAGSTRFTFTQYHMGIDARIVVYAESEDRAIDAAADAYKRIAELEQVMSDYRASSELMQLCAKAGQGPVKVSKDLMRVLVQAQEISRVTNGAFDVTVGPLIQLWRGARRAKELPTVAQVSAARNLVGWRMMKLDPRRGTVELIKPGMRLDLGGIAKGDAADEAMKVLKKHGIKSALIEMGGDILVSAGPPGTKGWRLEVPNASKTLAPPQMLFSNCAVSSSGDTEQFTEMNGAKWSHVVDPRTGWALTSRAQATIVAKSGLLSDPLSTAMTVGSEAERKALLQRWPKVRSWVRVLKD